MYKSRVSILCASLFSMLAMAQADAPVVRDPTMPLGHIVTGTTGQITQQFALNSILISAQRKLAIINGSSVREGQTIPGSANVIVKRISAQAVVLQQAEKTWLLRLSPSIVKRR